MPEQLVFEDHYKKLGLETFSEDNLSRVNGNHFKSDIKVFFIPSGYKLSVDFTHYTIEKASLFFLTNQHLTIEKGEKEGRLLYYNRDFYCIQIHDKEVACDGLLFHNVFEIPFVELDDPEIYLIENLFQNIKDELEWRDSSAEEMIRTYVKQIIIRATRKWKKQNLDNSHIKVPGSELDIFRDFSRYLEMHFREKHNVADYAALLHIAPKTLTHKFKSLHLAPPISLLLTEFYWKLKDYYSILINPLKK